MNGLTGFEPERGRENICFPVEEGMGKPWVFQKFLSGRSRTSQNRPKRRFCVLAYIAHTVDVRYTQNMGLLHTILLTLVAFSLFPQLFFATFAVMITDAGQSIWTALFLLGSWSMPPLTLVALLMSFGERKKGRIGGAILFLFLPLLSLLLILLAGAGMVFFCDGKTTC